MASEAASIALRQLSTRITKGTTPPKGVGFVTEGVNYIKSESIGADGRIDPTKFAYIDDRTNQAFQRSQLRPGNVLFSMAGVYLGKTAVVLDEHVPANTNQAVGIISLDADKADPFFVHYALQRPECRAWVSRSVAQSAQPNFNLQQIGDLPIPDIPRDEQRARSSVLKALDDRIDLLRQTNATLEAIAQTLFKSWFADFDPVRAKAEGREPEGMDPATAALFPSEFEEPELGLIPKGWFAGTLSDLSELNASKWSTKRRPDWISYIDLSGVSKNRIDPPTEYRFDDAPSRARHHLRDGDTIIGTVRPGNRAFAFMSEPASTLTGSTGFAVLSPRSPDLSSFVYLAATRDEAIERLANLADGGAYPAVRPSIVAATPCVVPQPGVRRAFSDITQPLLNRIARNESNARTLSEIRDTLLPRLISGKLRLPEVEKSIEEAVA